MKFHNGEIAVQTRAGVRQTAADVGESIHDRIPAGAADFLRPRRMVVVASIDKRGRVWASVVCGAPGFIELIDDRTVRIASLPAHGDPLIDNLAREGHVALFIPDFTAPRRLRLNGRGHIKDGAIEVHAEEVYGNCRRYIQERIFVGDRAFSQPLEPASARSAALSEEQRGQISKAHTFFIATDHRDAGADVSHKGGKPGFVRVVDASRLAFPDYNGNSMFNTLGNITANPNAGLLFIDFDSGRTLQLTGRAAIDWDPRRAQSLAGAERVVDLEIAEVVDNAAGFPLIAKFRQYSRFNP